VLAFICPAVVFAAGVWHTIAEDLARNRLLARLALFFFAATLALALYRRSQGREAVWFNARVLKEPGEKPEDQVFPLSADVVLILAAVFFAAISVVHP
jgi:hypothetical protein